MDTINRVFPQRGPKQWLLDTQAQLSHLLRSKDAHRNLHILSFEYQIDLMVHPSEGASLGMPLTLWLHGADTERAHAASALFGEKGVFPNFDHTIVGGGVTTCHILMYPLPGPARIAAKLLGELFERVYALPSDAELHFL
jgi:hypothetical protein